MPASKTGKKAPRSFGGGRPPSERESKLCPVCGRPFAWRKKWERDWASVRYCSDRCRAAAHRAGRTPEL